MKVLGYILLLAGLILVYMGYTGKTFGEVFKHG